MKFIVNREEFIKNLVTADSIVNVKSPLAMLLNVYIEALDDGTIMMLSYNGENGIKIEMTGVVDEAGKIALLSKKLLEAVRKMPGDKLVIRTKEGSEHEIMIHPEGLENPVFNINGVSGEAYPIFSEFNWENYIKIAQETLLEQIVCTEFSVSTDFSKPSFTGTYMEEAVEGYLSFVASDGKRLAVITREYEEKKGDVTLQVIIPERIFKTMQGILSTGEVLFSVHNNQAFFKVGNVYIFSNLVDGKFPNYREVIPSEKINIVNVDGSKFLEAIEVVAVMSDPETCKARAEVEGEKMVISTVHPIYGVAKEEIPVEYNGAPISIAFHYKAVADFLKVINNKKIDFVINSQSSPLLFRVTNDDNFVYISMPLRMAD
jgi:DNA polymerase-3 subunit beta